MSGPSSEEHLHRRQLTPQLRQLSNGYDRSSPVPRRTSRWIYLFTVRCRFKCSRCRLLPESYCG